MQTRNFIKMIENKWSEGKFICIGLDSDFTKIPECLRLDGFSKERKDIANVILEFNCAIVDVTKDLVCAYKPNSAFYEAYGIEGIIAMRKTVEYINNVAPDIPIIVDAKRGDIGNTNNGYIKFFFDLLNFNAITVSPYLGGESLEPFFSLKDKGIIVVCKSSNSGSGEIQDLIINNEPLYCFIARQAANKWNKNGNCCLVVGATYPDELSAIRKIVGDMPILIPGIGEQGGDLKKTIIAGRDSRGWGMIISSSRGIIFASKEKDFAQSARAKTKELMDMF